MSKSSIIKKVRIPRIRPIEPTPKEKEAWEHFVALAREMSSGANEMPAIVRVELDRLVSKGNPLALRLRRRIEAASFSPRNANEAPLPAPAPRRIKYVHWQKENE